jgi:hypothetical protein
MKLVFRTPKNHCRKTLPESESQGIFDSTQDLDQTMASENTTLVVEETQSDFTEAQELLDFSPSDGEISVLPNRDSESENADLNSLIDYSSGLSLNKKSPEVDWENLDAIHDRFENVWQDMVKERRRREILTSFLPQ